MTSNGLGATAPVGDTDGLANAIAALPDAVPVARRRREKVLLHHSRCGIAARCIALYEELCQGSGP
jgi:hypothetical protein